MAVLVRDVLSRPEKMPQPAMPPLPAMLDLQAIAIVVIGTGLATLAQVGSKNMRQTVSALLAPAINEDAIRKDIARAVQSITNTGPLRSNASLPSDPLVAQCLNVYLRGGAVATIQTTYEIEQSKALARHETIAEVFDTAAELAPMFGLVGTLWAIFGLAPTTGDDPAAYVTSAIGTAVLSSLYGVLLAHLVISPLGGWTDRKLERSACTRRDLIDWFVDQIRTHNSHKNEATPPSIRDAA